MAHEADSNPPFERLTVVVADDDAEVRDLETFLLESEEYRVVSVSDGDAVIRAVRGEAPALLLLDFMLPGKDANEVLAELSRDPETARVPVLVVSAYRELLRPFAQVRGVIPKPFDIMELLDAVRRECPRRA